MRRVEVLTITREEAIDNVDFPMYEFIPREIFKGTFDEDVIFYAGIEEIIPGVGEIWIIFKKPAEEYPGAWIAIKRLMDDVFKTEKYHRLQSHVIKGSVSVGFNLHLGMEIEGVMHNFAYGEDYIIMARVK